LAGELRDPVRRERPRGRVLGGRVRGRVAVDRRRAREDGPGAAGNCRLEEALTREDVVTNVERERAAEAAHAGLAREVEDAVDAREIECVLGEIDPLDGKP